LGLRRVTQSADDQAKGEGASYELRRDRQMGVY
jgi:hypothetical protein